MSPKYLKRIGIPLLNRTAAVLEEYELRFEKRAIDDPQKGYANIVPALGSKVYGIIFDIDEEHLSILDEIEHYPTGYTRKNVDVSAQNCEKVEVVTYVANENMIGSNLLPSREYLQLICESEDLLPKKYLDTVRLTKTLDDLNN